MSEINNNKEILILNVYKSIEQIKKTFKNDNLSRIKLIFDDVNQLSIMMNSAIELYSNQKAFENKLFQIKEFTQVIKSEIENFEFKFDKTLYCHLLKELTTKLSILQSQNNEK